MKQKSLSGQLIELGYEGSTFNYWEIKEWLWNNHRFYFSTTVFSKEGEKQFRLLGYIKGKGQRVGYIYSTSPILIEIEGIKHAVDYLYSQTAAGCSAKNNGA